MPTRQLSFSPHSRPNSFLPYLPSASVFLFLSQQSLPPLYFLSTTAALSFLPSVAGLPHDFCVTFISTADPPTAAASTWSPRSFTSYPSSTRSSTSNKIFFTASAKCPQLSPPPLLLPLPLATIPRVQIGGVIQEFNHIHI
ncbi:hypothetical protein ABFS83_07G075000 [Erythranthe nasuta]